MKMDEGISISSGMFFHTNGLQPLSESRGGGRIEEDLSTHLQSPSYRAYKRIRSKADKRFEELNGENFSNILTNVVDFIKTSYINHVTEIPTTALILGGMFEGATPFFTLTEKIQKEVSPHVTYIWDENQYSIKSLMDYIIEEFLTDSDEMDVDFESRNETAGINIAKTNFSLPVLQAWYEDKYGTPFQLKTPSKLRTKSDRKALVVIFPTLENCNEKVLQDFILIISSYMNVLPFVLIFGIATSASTMHKMLPYQVSSKINVTVFNCHQSTSYLSTVLEHVLFRNECPFHLSGDVLALFVHIFLFFDYSVTSFIHKFNYAMHEHFSCGNMMALCTISKNVNGIVDALDSSDCEDVRHLMSFRKLVKSECHMNRIKLFIDDDYLKSVLKEKVQIIYKYLDGFHIFLKCLHLLVADLPNHPMGKELWELYVMATTSSIVDTEAYIDCFKLLSFQSKDQLLEKSIICCGLIEEGINSSKLNRNNLEQELGTLCDLIEELKDAPLENLSESTKLRGLDVEKTSNRRELREKLLGLSKANELPNHYEAAKNNVLNYISGLFEKYLYEPRKNYFHEIFFFNDLSIKDNVLGTQRIDIQRALLNPHYYLHGGRIQIDHRHVILSSMPDICIVYKLHLEYGKLIKMSDWLQAFAAVVNPIGINSIIDDNEGINVSPELKARFDRAVANLQFIVIVKCSKRKPGYVKKLTWDENEL